MLHRKIVQPALADLEGERADYFHLLIQGLDEDPRTEPIANLVYLTLRATIPFLPIYLDRTELTDSLIEFVTANQQRLNRTIFDRGFIDGSKSADALNDITNEFVSQVLAAILKKYDGGEVEDHAQTTYRFSGDFENDDFPYKDPDG